MKLASQLKSCQVASWTVTENNHTQNRKRQASENSNKLLKQRIKQQFILNA